jgi:anti-anti-sigma factor
MTDYKRFDIQTEGDVLVLHMADPRLFETLLVNELEDELLSIIDQRQPTKVIVNFERVTHCSTSVINGLLRGKKRLTRTGGSLKLCGMRDTVREAYRILNLDGTVFEIYDDVNAALKSF